MLTWRALSLLALATALCGQFCIEASEPEPDHYGMVDLGLGVFGNPIAMDGDRALVGGSGRAYVFDLDTMQLVSMLRPGEQPSGFSSLGLSLAIDGGFALVGDPFTQAAYAFDTATSRELFKLQPSRTSGAGFELPVAVEGYTAVVAAVVPGAESERELYLDVFDLRDGRRVRSIDTNLRDYSIPQTIALDGGLVAIGGYQLSDGLPSVDDVRVVVFDVATGEQVRVLTPPGEDPGERPSFGAVLAMNSGRLAIGEQSNLAAPGSGAVDVFDLSTGALLHEFTSNVAESKDLFGSAVALSGDVLLVGAPRDETDIEGTLGTVHVFDVATGGHVPLLPFDQDGILSRPGNEGSFGSVLAAHADLAIMGVVDDQVYVVPIPEPVGLTLLGVGLPLLCAPLLRGRKI